MIIQCLGFTMKMKCLLKQYVLSFTYSQSHSRARGGGMRVELDKFSKPSLEIFADAESDPDIPRFFKKVTL